MEIVTQLPKKQRQVFSGASAVLDAPYNLPFTQGLQMRTLLSLYALLAATCCAPATSSPYFDQHPTVSEATVYQGLPERFQPGDVFVDVLSVGAAGPQMVVIPPGTFLMGSPETEEGRYWDEGPQQQITLGYSFAIGRFEITFDDYWQCYDAGACVPTGNWVLDRDDPEQQGLVPLHFVNLIEVQDYLEWLSNETGEIYRLPSEAEWEYAARGGFDGPYSQPLTENSLCDIANFDDGDEFPPVAQSQTADCSDGYREHAPVGSYLPNGFGLYDMHGNVAEIVADCYSESLSGTPLDGAVRPNSECRDDLQTVVRGGSYFTEAEYTRSAARLNWTGPNTRLMSNGFRALREINLPDQEPTV